MTILSGWASSLGGAAAGACAPPFLPGQKFPVVYALDGGHGVAGGAGALLGGASVMAPAYMVEVGYLPGQAAFRDTDLAHVIAKPQFGGPAFGGVQRPGEGDEIAPIAIRLKEFRRRLRVTTR